MSPQQSIAGEREQEHACYHLPCAGMIRVRFQGSRRHASSQPYWIDSPGDVYQELTCAGGIVKPDTLRPSPN